MTTERLLPLNWESAVSVSDSLQPVRTPPAAIAEPPMTTADAAPRRNARRLSSVNRLTLSNGTAGVERDAARLSVHGAVWKSSDATEGCAPNGWLDSKVGCLLRNTTVRIARYCEVWLMLMNIINSRSCAIHGRATGLWRW